MFPLMWFFMTHCLMLQRSRDNPNAWLSHEPQCSTRTSHFIRYAFNVKTFIFRNTLCKWFEYSCDIYCLRLNQKTHNYTQEEHEDILRSRWFYDVTVLQASDLWKEKKNPTSIIALALTEINKRMWKFFRWGKTWLELHLKN